MPKSDETLSYASALSELNAITQWWLQHSPDQQQGGFIGEIDYYGKTVANANKGIILNSRILWFFSEVALFCNDANARAMATRAYDYLRAYFDDPIYGGAVWELDSQGAVVNGKKQIYAQCFCIYGFVAYYRLTKDQQALLLAEDYFSLIERHARDYQYGGYIDALSQQWGTVSDFRLSDKDLNTSKTMNTHLHILEAYTALMQVSPGAQISAALKHNIEIFVDNIIDHDSHHVKLFFDNEWRRMDTHHSYGHDIEASWLLWESLQTLRDASLLERYRPIVIQLAETCRLEALTEHGQLREGFDLATKSYQNESVWWTQAEALPGFLNAYQLTGDRRYIDSCNAVWRHIRHNHVDTDAGEWHWLAAERGEIKSGNYKKSDHYKLGFWKAPYHNGRAMMEVCRRFKALAMENS